MVGDGRAVRRKAPTPSGASCGPSRGFCGPRRADGIRDLTSSYRLVRISVLRDLLRAVGDGPACAGDARTANADLLMRMCRWPGALNAAGRTYVGRPAARDAGSRVSDGRTCCDGRGVARSARLPSSAPEPAAENTPRHTRGTRLNERAPELRLESRADWSAEGTATPADNTRHAASRDARAGRKARPARRMSDSKHHARAKAKPVERESIALASDGDAEAREKPARRKRRVEVVGSVIRRQGH